MNMKTNRLRELLATNQPSLGTHIQITWLGIVELIGRSKMFDYVEFLGEYTSFSMHDLDNLGRAVELFPHMSSMMKIEQTARTHWVMRAIGSGIQNVLFADPRTREDIEECVRAVRAESPETGGIHGVGMRRDVGYVIEAGKPAFVEALEDAVIAVMIEKDSAVRDLEKLLAVKGVDMVQFGPADYSMSIGLTGQTKHPKVLNAEDYVIKTAFDMGIVPRAEIVSPEDAKRYLDMGVQHFCMGWDLKILYDWYKGRGEEMGNMLSKEREI
jgi:2-keto-3-deoxy-L-rhamnonate aldolase RhmA